MKKLIALIFVVSSIWAQNIKTDYFVGLGVGTLTISDQNDQKQYIEGKIGGYFYDPNEFLISNRMYLSVSNILSSNTSFYVSKLNLDWIWNQIPYIKPFFGLSGGYIYYAYDKTNYSSGCYGLQAGVLMYLGNSFELEVGGNIDHPTQNRDVWLDTLKKIYVSLNISF